ncbi:exopolysaccharide biosynthesis protein [Alloacidobacterium dinghuense]|uniref:protein-tyrosine-phosphatase n=1 Tax=Alloacidobacterium dinghuense TaxID=2763107 RepID=A0A7G8BKL7_9BACT|nr:CpsB/CapC family capsule biosynthesis tyrosine phosphatase [Alloacidobacterium dinghuense]QNI33087.1 exopolysaccharide biosynthesis protein [Alloacidobacterium dinghuense]
MIDIHHHLLFGLDDGSLDLDTSVAMAEMAANDGITHIVCTPHANHRYNFDPAENADRLAQLQQRLDGRITFGLGCDFHLSFDNIEDAFENKTKYTINQKQYLLVEFADLMIPQGIADTFYEMKVAGMHPIITHPERNHTIQRHPNRMVEWLREGCLVQVTASSLTGRFGKTAQAMAFSYLDKNWVHFIATDAHNLTSRPPVMSEAYKLVENMYGKETAERICVTNPQAAFYSADFPPQPEMLGLYEEEEMRPRKTFLSRLFSTK